MFQYVLLAATGIGAWLLTEFVGRPFRRFYDLRREVNHRLVQYGNVSARAKMTGNVREVIDLPLAQDALLTEAQNKFRDLAGEMRAFANGEYFANWTVKRLGYDANKIASALIGYSNNISTYGDGRSQSHNQVEKLLRVRAEE